MKEDKIQIQAAYEAIQALSKWCTGEKLDAINLLHDLEKNPSAVLEYVENTGRKYGITYERSSFNEDGYYLYLEAKEALSALI